MTRDELESTEWAGRVRAKCTLTVYEEAIHRVMDHDFQVEIIKYNECCDEDETQWVISTKDDFWLETFDTEEEAISFCEKMTWKIV